MGSGKIVIPVDQWARFKQSFKTAYNEQLSADLAQASRAIEKVKADRKGKRGTDWEHALRQELAAEDSVGHTSWSGFGGPSTKCRYPMQVLDTYDLVSKAIVRKERSLADGTKTLSTKLRTLKKKDFPRANGKTAQFQVGHAEASIALDDKQHAVHWQVFENNHACERARGAYLGRKLFELLGSIQWKRNSGGCISGNNEYSREDTSLGGGANALKDSFGPLGEQKRKEYFGRRFHRSRR